ncbi:Threonine efflux protein [Corynebacterium atrinae]|uniref:LysE family translocator n=1 Tax=Corynebacterium atrinae TaxID=1336740 RepID=UPI0025B4A478|nr:LysE family translocator [Corynebacterium atrinae]WJY62253.1 Threonine efflux protein [Corynebacterium atrinae]
MTSSSFVSLLVVWIAAIVSPGPDVVQLIRVGSRSRAAGVWCALGIMLGNALWILASLLGLSALVGAYPQILTALQLLGGLYLLRMGIGAVRSGRAARGVPVQAATGAEAEAMPPARALLLGLTTNLANPKALLFFGAIFAQFVRPDMGVGWAVLIVATLVFTGIAWFVGFALGVRAMAARIAKHSAIIDIVTGIIFIGLGLLMVVEGGQAVVSSLT